MAFGATVALVTAAASTMAPPRPAARAMAFVWALTAVALAPLLVNPFLFDARPDLVAVPLLLAGMLRAEKRNGWDGRSVAWLAAAALVREEFAIAAAAALIGFLPRREQAGASDVATRRWGIGGRLAAAAVFGGWFAGYWWLVRPSLGEGFASARADQAAADLFQAVGPDVGRFRAAFVLALVTFGGGLALRGWRWLAAAAPGVAFAAATTKLASHALNFHYVMFAAPALAVAAVAGLRALADRRGGNGRAFEGAVGLSIAVGIAASLAFGAHPAGRRFQAEHFAMDPVAAEWLAECHALLATIPPDDGAAIAPMFGALFADRSVVWSLETLHQHLVDVGEVPDGVRWVAIENNQFGTLGRVLVNRHGFQLVGIAAGRLALFERPEDAARVPPVVAQVGVEPRCETVFARWPEVGVALCDLRAEDERLVALLVRERAPVGVPALAVTAEVAGQPTVLEAVFGLLDPATIPAGVGVPVRSRDRVLAPTVRLHVQDLTGRHYAGVVSPGVPPALGVDVAVGASP